MKRLLGIIGLCCLPILIMILVNENMPKVSASYNSSQCSRACHDSHCLHFEKKLKDASYDAIPKRYFGVYQKTMYWLKHNPFGLSYVEMNMLVYVILFPLCFVILLWKLLQ